MAKLINQDGTPIETATREELNVPSRTPEEIQEEQNVMFQQTLHYRNECRQDIQAISKTVEMLRNLAKDLPKDSKPNQELNQAIIRDIRMFVDRAAICANYLIITNDVIQQALNDRNIAKAKADAIVNKAVQDKLSTPV